MLRRYAVIGVLIFLLAACQPPTLWGVPPVAPTSALPEPVLPLLFPRTSTPTLIPPTITPTSTPAPLLWIDPAVPPRLHSKVIGWGISTTNEKQAASVFVELTDASDSSTQWIYALVAPFPTVTDGVTLYTLRDAWNASSSGPFAGLPLLMDESTLEVFTVLWGEPAEGAVQVVAAGALLDRAWDQMPSWGIIPFEDIQPRWKVLTIDGQSPLHKAFDVTRYPLVANFSFSSDLSAISSQYTLPATNRDPEKLATVILTGVTAMARATAKTMNVRGVLFPGQDIRELMREADIAHINNEVPFFSGCPDPDPNQVKEIFCSAPRYIELLLDIGTDVVELSGDHFADYGDKAMEETVAIYKENNLPYYGGGLSFEEGKQPLLMEANGNKFMFIACNIKDIYATASDTRPGSVICDFPYMTEQIQYYRGQGYLPISTFQYHEFTTPEARPQQEEDFRRMADAGAVIVSGSQAHVPQMMEFHGDAFIHYGLGNLFFDQMTLDGGSKNTRREFIDRHVFYDGKYLGVELFTMYLEDFSRPRYMTDVERTRFLTDYFQFSGWLPEQ
ncbi:MAG: CapA family protein [Chloroflexota bacterium]